MNGVVTTTILLAVTTYSYDTGFQLLGNDNCTRQGDSTWTVTNTTCEGTF